MIPGEEVEMSQKANQGTVWVVGLARNCASRLDRNVQYCRRALTGQKQNYVFVVSENDIPTYNTIRELENKTENVHVILEESVAVQKYLVRTQKLAVLRDAYVDFLKTRVTHLDKVLIVDWDIKIENLELEGPVKEHSENSVATSISIPRYYDIFALRLQEEDALPTTLDVELRAKNPFRDFYQPVSRSQILMTGLIEKKIVRSAFGGMALYPARVFKHGKYSSAETKAGICEHVSFHDSVRDKLESIYIEPTMVVRAPREHILFSNIFSRFALLVLSIAPDPLARVFYRGMRGLLNVIK